MLNRQRRPPEALLRLYFYCLRGLSVLIEVQRRETYLVVPVDGEGVEAERLEVIKVLQFATDALLHQRREVHQPLLSYPAFEELRDKEQFIQFGLEDTIFWKNGADVAPERLYELGKVA